jgi:predicted DNA-binding protein (MmcQ/YjbR family)
MVKDLIEDSYDLVVQQLPAARRRELGSTTDAQRA